MLRNTLVFAGLVSLGAAYPAMKQQGWFDSATPEQTKPASISIAKVETPAAQLAGRTVRIAADARGHYASDFTINGRKVSALIDTGASVVAFNRSTARRLGVSVSTSDFTREVNTANGTIKAAPVVLSKVEIGKIQVRDVAAVVLEDGALDGALIGMSFLKPLRFSVEDGTFVLKQ